MSEFDDFIKGIGTDIKNVAEHVGKKTEEAFEISKRKAEKVRIKGRIQSAYQRLVEIVYGSMKNGEDVSDETAALVLQLDDDFDRIREIYQEINEIKNGTYVEEEETHWDEEYAEDEDEEEPEVEVEIIVAEEIPAEIIETEEPVDEAIESFVKEDHNPAREEEFNIYAD